VVLLINFRIICPSKQVVNGTVQVVSDFVYFINRRNLPFFHIVKHAFVETCVDEEFIFGQTHFLAIDIIRSSIICKLYTKTPPISC